MKIEITYKKGQRSSRKEIFGDLLNKCNNVFVIKIFSSFFRECSTFTFFILTSSKYWFWGWIHRQFNYFDTNSDTVCVRLYYLELEHPLFRGGGDWESSSLDFPLTKITGLVTTPSRRTTTTTMATWLIIMPNIF